MYSNQLIQNEHDSYCRNNNINDLRNGIISLECLYHDNDYLFISKPYDVRMDGEGDITLEKLLIKNFNGTKKDYKWIHQLDYATSGVLCVGLNRKAAAFASLCFAERKTYKEYLALVYGKVEISKITNIISDQDLNNLRLNLSNNDTKRKINCDHSVSKWQNEIKENNLLKCFEVLKNLNDSNIESNYKTQLNELLSIPYEKYQINAKIRKQLRKLLKSLNLLPPLEESKFSDISNESNLNNGDKINIDYKCYDLNESNHITSTRLNQIYKLNNDHILVMIPVTEIEGSFHCELESESHQGKYAETEVIIESYGMYQNKEVTMLRLIPKTGRRHQLRLHCLALGHPIVGDCTYANDTFCPQLAHRMMLHAFKLRIPKDVKICDTTTNEIDYIEIITDNPFLQYLR